MDRAADQGSGDAVAVAQGEAERPRGCAVVDRDHREGHRVTGIGPAPEDGERAGSFIEDLRIDARGAEVGAAPLIGLVHEFFVVVLTGVEVELEVGVP